MTLHPLRRNRGPEPAAPICEVCNGEGYAPIFAHDGSQTQYTARCPHCGGVGWALPLEREGF